MWVPKELKGQRKEWNSSCKKEFYIFQPLKHLRKYNDSKDHAIIQTKKKISIPQENREIELV